MTRAFPFDKGLKPLSKILFTRPPSAVTTQERQNHFYAMELQVKVHDSQQNSISFSSNTDYPIYIILKMAAELARTQQSRTVDLYQT